MATKKKTSKKRSKKVQRRRRRLLVGLLAGGAVSLLTALGVVYGLYRLYLARPVDPTAATPVAVSIPQGAGFRGAVAHLERAGVVRSPLFFGAHAWIEGRASGIQAGTHRLDLRQTPPELLLVLTEGSPDPSLALRFREGEDVWDLAERLAQLGIASEAAAAEVLRDRSVAAQLGVPAPDDGLPDWASPFEGFLFPATYHLRLGETVPEVLTRMLAKQRRVFGGLRAQHAATPPPRDLDERELVTLASLIEAEVREREESPVVAGVFYNRLARDMELQTDPTLVYHPDYRGQRARPRHRKDHTKPYNTYARKGLPPGPIGNPGRDALAAALAPARHDFLYFVARQDGSGRHHFSRTREEHRAAVERYLR